ncbi:MAG: ABC transporter substrate-binding protein [Chloroflexi bacterium]|nr:ABC transporter substrate-binding protein [Chloroflexota bacterium]
MFVKRKMAMGLLAGLMALVLLAVACGGSDDDEDDGTTGSGEPQSGGTLRVGMVNDVFDFDPPVMVNMPSLAGLPHLYDNLVIRNPDGTLRPMLAESWETNDDASQWTFYLRKGVKFHHGKEFKAEDVIFSINRLFEKKSPLASVMVQPTNMVAVDDYTLRLEFDGPNAVLLESLVKYHAVITPSDVDPERFLAEEFGTGPLILTEHITGERTVFRKNEDYWWEGHPFVDEVIFVYLPSPEARAEALKAGTIDVIFDLDIASVLTLEADPNTIVVAAPTSGYLNLAMDQRESPFDNVLVRKAIQAVTDRQAILQIAQFGMGGIAFDHPIAVTDPVFNESCKPPEYDVELAKSLLAEAGYPNGIDLTLYTSSTGGGSMVELATVMKEKAAPAGINIKIVNVPETNYWSETWMQQPFTTVWWGGRPPYEAFSVVYPSDAAWNESFWNNPEVDSLLDTALGQGDLEDQKVTFGRLQCIVVEEVPRIIPVFRPVLLGIRAEVQDLVPMPDFTLQLRETWLSQ